MKNLFPTLFFLLILLSCSDDSRVNNSTETSTTLESEQLASTSVLNPQVVIENTPANTLELSISRNNYEILFNSSVGQGSTQSSFTFLKDGQQMFNMNFWMLLCDIVYADVMDSIVVKADDLIDLGIRKSDLEVANDMIVDAHPDILNQLQTNEGRKLELLSNIFFQKAILTTASRAISSGEECECTPHPKHLMGESYFLCQEDLSYNVAELQGILSDYVDEYGPPDAETSDLISFLNSTTEQDVRFDEVYNFYFPKSQYIQMLEGVATSTSQSNSIAGTNNMNSGDCAWYCILGCGSEIGCCGNYSGCCVYRTFLCFWHDIKCKNCEFWHCGPACVPESQLFIITFCNWYN